MAVVVKLCGGGDLLLALAAPGGGHPGAPDVGGAGEATALAAGAAAEVDAVLLGLIAAVPAAHAAARLRFVREDGAAAAGVDLTLLLPQLEPTGGVPSGGVLPPPAAATAGFIKKEPAFGRRDSASRRLMTATGAAASEKKSCHNSFSTALIISLHPSKR